MRDSLAQQQKRRVTFLLGQMGMATDRASYHVEGDDSLVTIGEVTFRFFLGEKTEVTATYNGVTSEKFSPTRGDWQTTSRRLINQAPRTVAAK